MSIVSYIILLSITLSINNMNLSAGFNAFASVNLGGLYLDAVSTAADCIPNVMGAFIGSALNSDGSAVADFVSDKSETLPYPFSCVEPIINIFNNRIKEAIISYSNDEPVDLTIPSIPEYSD